MAKPTRMMSALSRRWKKAMTTPSRPPARIAASTATYQGAKTETMTAVRQPISIMPSSATLSAPERSAIEAAQRRQQERRRGAITVTKKVVERTVTRSSIMAVPPPLGQSPAVR